MASNPDWGHVRWTRERRRKDSDVADVLTTCQILRRQRTFTDVTVFCGSASAFASKGVSLHRIVLAAYSPFLAELLRDREDAVLILPDCDPNDFLNLVHIMYGEHTGNRNVSSGLLQMLRIASLSSKRSRCGELSSVLQGATPNSHFFDDIAGEADVDVDSLLKGFATPAYNQFEFNYNTGGLDLSAYLDVVREPLEVAVRTPPLDSPPQIPDPRAGEAVQRIAPPTPFKDAVSNYEGSLEWSEPPETEQWSPDDSLEDQEELRLHLSSSSQESNSSVVEVIETAEKVLEDEEEGRSLSLSQHLLRLHLKQQELERQRQLQQEHASRGSSGLPRSRRSRRQSSAKAPRSPPPPKRGDRDVNSNLEALQMRRIKILQEGLQELRSDCSPLRRREKHRWSYSPLDEDEAPLAGDRATATPSSGPGRKRRRTSSSCSSEVEVLAPSRKPRPKARTNTVEIQD